MVIIKVFILGALLILSNQNLHIGISSERQVFFDSYTGWITSIVDQVVDVTGYVIKFEWLPK